MNIIVVDEQDTEIGVKSRDEITPSDIYRITLLWITDSKGRVLLAQRAYTKAKHPGLWAAAVAGTVEEGETYDSNVVKETQEEIGVTVTIDELTKGPKLRFNDGVRSNHFAQSYRYTTDLPISAFVPQVSEVEKLEWFEPEALKELVKSSPEMFTNTSKAWLDLFLT